MRVFIACKYRWKKSGSWDLFQLSGFQLSGFHCICRMTAGLLMALPPDSTAGSNCERGPYTWIGLRSPIQNMQQWNWTDGTAVDYTNWASGERFQMSRRFFMRLKIQSCTHIDSEIR